MQNSNQNIVVMKRKMKERRDGRTEGGRKERKERKKKEWNKFKDPSNNTKYAFCRRKKSQVKCSRKQLHTFEGIQRVLPRRTPINFVIHNGYTTHEQRGYAGAVRLRCNVTLLQTIDKIKCFNIIIGYRIFNNTINAPKFQHNFYGSHGGLCYCTSDIWWVYRLKSLLIAPDRTQLNWTKQPSVVTQFLPRYAMRMRGLCCGPVSVRLSVCHVGVLYPDG